MHKNYIAGISIFLILVVLLFTKAVQNRKFAIFNPVSPALAEEIWNGKTRVERFDFGSLMCNGIQVAIDRNEKDFYIPVNMENPEWETLRFTSGKPEYQIVFQDDFTRYDKQELIASGTHIEFLVYTDTEFSTYEIIFTGLPVMDISTLEGIEHQKEISGNAVFYDTNFSSSGAMASAYEGHVRGNTSTLYPKKGYKINLINRIDDNTVENNKLPLFGMRNDDDWILYALYSDESKIRAKLSIDLWDEMGAKNIYPNANYNSSIKYIELIVDEAYHGMYAIMEPVDAKQLNLKEEDYLYKREDIAELEGEAFYAAENPEEHVQGFEIKEGILLADAWKPMGYFSDFINSEDENFKQNINQVLDTENAIRLWLYLQVIAGYDQQGKNVFYVARKEGDSYFFTFAPWDMDLTFGNHSANDEETNYTDYDENLVREKFFWETGERIIKQDTDDAVKKMQKLYNEYRRTILSEKGLEDRISTLDHVIRDSGAYARDQQRWTEGSYAEDAGVIMSFAKRRMEYLDKALFNLETYMKEEIK